jgi:hypothetical protein
MKLKPGIITAAKSKSRAFLARPGRPRAVATAEIKADEPHLRGALAIGAGNSG